MYRLHDVRLHVSRGRVPDGDTEGEGVVVAVVDPRRRAGGHLPVLGIRTRHRVLDRFRIRGPARRGVPAGAGARPPVAPSFSLRIAEKSNYIYSIFLIGYLP